MVITPNGGAIYIVAQDDLDQEQIIRARSVLKHYLKDLPGSKYGDNKALIANKMAENGAVFLLLNGQDDGSNEVDVPGQPLYKNEIQVEGHPWYVKQDYEHRDATFEEILHLVHDYGIGVDGPYSFPRGGVQFQKKIRAVQKNAFKKKIWGWGIDTPEWITRTKERQ